MPDDRTPGHFTVSPEGIRRAQALLKGLTVLPVSRNRRRWPPVDGADARIVPFGRPAPSDDEAEDDEAPSEHPDYEEVAELYWRLRGEPNMAVGWGSEGVSTLARIGTDYFWSDGDGGCCDEPLGRFATLDEAKAAFRAANGEAELDIDLSWTPFEDDEETEDEAADETADDGAVTTKAHPAACPECGEEEAIQDLDDHRRVELARGSVVVFDAPKLTCAACGHTWRARARRVLASPPDDANRDEWVAALNEMLGLGPTPPEVT